MDQWHTQPSEFDKLSYYRIEYMEEDLRELLNEKNKTSDSGKSDTNAQSSMFKNQQRAFKQSTPKIPKTIKFK